MRWRPPGSAIQGCTTRTATRNWPTVAARSRSHRSVPSTGSRWTTTMTCAGPGALLADRRIATQGRVAVAVGPSQHGTGITARLQLAEAEVFRVEAATVDSAVHLGKRLRTGCYEAVAGIGGGRTIDVTKF